jgi:nitroreductase
VNSAINNGAGLLLTRRSTPVIDLAAPGPTAAQLDALLSAALRVPDHSRLTPWRIQIVRDESRARLAGSFERAYRSETAVPEEARIEKLKRLALGAPVVLVVSSKLVRGHKVPEVEQLLSGGALCQNILLAAHAAGFGAVWLTGFAAYSPGVKQALGIAAPENVLGFIALGTAGREAPERARPALNDIVSEWRGQVAPQ